MRSALLMRWTLLSVSLSLPPLLDKMVDDEANNEQEDEGPNAEDFIPHLLTPLFSASWRFRLPVFLLPLVSYHRLFMASFLPQQTTLSPEERRLHASLSSPWGHLSKPREVTSLLRFYYELPFHIALLPRKQSNPP